MAVVTGELIAFTKVMPALVTVAQDVSVPFVVRYFPVLLVWLGARALNAVLAVVCPVPPLAIGKAVPEYVMAKVPELVIGEPVIDKNDGTVAATEVTVPVGAFTQVGPDMPLPCKSCPGMLCGE